jgi:pilus assembly protein TadC
MSYEEIKENIGQIKEIIREIYVFTNQLEVIKNLEDRGDLSINAKEKKLLKDAIFSLERQLKILVNSIPGLVNNIKFHQKLIPEKTEGRIELKTATKEEKLVKIKYTPLDTRKEISITVSEGERKEFIDNISKSNLSIRQLKKKYTVSNEYNDLGKPSKYAKISNRYFKKLSDYLIKRGYFNNLNKDLRKINSPFVLRTYVSMIFLTILITFCASFFLLILLLFINFSIIPPFLELANDPLTLRFAEFFWIIIFFPFLVGFIFYFYPTNERANLGKKIDNELPFVAIHLSAIATSKLAIMEVFKVILVSGEYQYTNIEFRKFINLVNFQGQDPVTALKNTAKASPSARLRELLNGLATTITTGGDLHQFLDKHSESLLFDYKLEREKYTKTAETFMDIYISVGIAAPMIFLMLFIMMGSTGLLTNLVGFDAKTMGLLIMLGVVVLNTIFLVVLKLKQPPF